MTDIDDRVRDVLQNWNQEVIEQGRFITPISETLYIAR